MYRPSKENVRADALSRREQDLPKEAEDERLQKRFVQILKPTNSYYEESIEEGSDRRTLVMTMRLRSQRETEAASSSEDQSDELEAQHQQEEEAAHLTKEGSEQPYVEELGEEQNELEKLWQGTATKDRVYQGAKQAIEDQERRFPVSLGLKCSTKDCSVEEGVLFYRGRKWVPDSDELRTAVISNAHDSLATGHLGRELTYKILARDHF